MSGHKTHPRASLLSAAPATIALVAVVCLMRSFVGGQIETPPRAARSSIPQPAPAGDETELADGPELPRNDPATAADSMLPPTENDPIAIHADYSQEWNEDDGPISLLRGRCRVIQGSTVLAAERMVVWRETETTGWHPRDRLAIYLEGDVRVERPGGSLANSVLFITLVTRDGVTSSVRRPLSGKPAADDALLARAREHRARAGRRAALEQTQLVIPGEPGPELRSLQIPPQAGGVRRMRIFPRSAVPFRLETRQSDLTIPPEQVWVLTGGVNVVIDNVAEFGTVDLAADRMVIWTQTAEQFRPQLEQSSETPLQIYMEGNIVIRQENPSSQWPRNVITASRAFYDVREERGLLLDAELKAFIPVFGDTVRVRAVRLRQLAENSFHAQNAWTSTSPYGKPGYRLQASDVFFEERYVAPLFGPPPVDPVTGRPEPTPYITSLNNTFFVGDVPLMYLPYLASPARDPSTPIRRATVKQDRIFGFQVKTTWDMFALLGIDEPGGVTWDLLADFYSKRGPALGTSGDYKGTELFGITGSFFGDGMAYGVLDDGEDNLGLGRRDLDPPQNERYRVQLRHWHNLPNNVTLIGELGLLSDRNFLESFFENDFDTGKDVETIVYGKQQLDNFAWTLQMQPQLNEFETTTEWLPRGDLYVLSEPLGNWLTWSTHTSAAFARLEPAEAPDDPRDVFVPLPYVTEADGALLMSRHGVNAPFNLGPVKVVPYALGEGAFWSEGFNEQQIDRWMGSAGLRGSLMFWRVFPFVQSDIFNLNGLAHKILLEADYSVTDVTENLSNVPQYNEIDDNAQQRWRQRFPLLTYGGMVPPEFDPRFYAVRTGAGRMVTAPYHELVQDQQVLRMAVRQRLQTKVGPPDRLRIRDWMSLDLSASFFPRADRDNFGEEFGLLGADYAWNIGERTSILANAQYDLFENAQQVWNVAVLTQRSTRGSLYVGVRQIKGRNLDSQILSASYSYQMSPKWISTLGTAYDLGEERNAGQSLTVTRVGLDWLWHFGANFDQSKDNAGIAVAVEPKFGPFRNGLTRMSSLLQPGP